MSRLPSDLEIATAPFLVDGPTTSRVMVEVLVALVPAVIAAAWYFGVTALLVVSVAVVATCGTEWLLGRRGPGLGSLRDGSALLTGVLFALTLPPGMPLWMVALGGIVAVVLGKVIWGGLGQNLFNPALVGRAFLQAAFPEVITTWTAPGAGFWHTQASTFAVPMMQPQVDTITTATPLGLAKFEHQFSALGPLLSGDTAGSLGETAAILLLVVGVWLAVRRIFDWRLPVATLVAVAAFAGVMWLIDASAYPTPLFMLGSGGLLFGVVFMVTDPVTTPVTPRGAWVFGLGVGLLVVLIRLWGGLPEGVMYAILLMNGVTPLINRLTQPRRFGG